MKLDNGQDVKFIPTPKEIAKKLMEISLSTRERKLVDTIIAQTYGYQAYKDGNESVRRTIKPLSSRYLSLLSNIPRSTVNYELERLERRNIIKIKEGRFKGQPTNHIGMNLHVGQWDNNTHMIPEKEYVKLHKQAKESVKSWWAEVNPITSQPGWDIKEGKRRERIDLIAYHIDIRKFNINVIIKVSWEDNINWSYLDVPNMPNTYFCFVNKPMTFMALIPPSGIKDLELKDGRYRVPAGLDSNGNKRIKIFKLKEQTDSNPVPKQQAC